VFFFLRSVFLLKKRFSSKEVPSFLRSVFLLKRP